MIARLAAGRVNLPGRPGAGGPTPSLASRHRGLSPMPARGDAYHWGAARAADRRVPSASQDIAETVPMDSSMQVWRRF
jgi:hypothetical protein